jgi:hypothetical protein
MAQAKRKDRSDSDEAATETHGADAAATATEPWQKPAALSRSGQLVIALVVLAVNLPLIHYYFFRPAPEATASVPYQDAFIDSSTVASNYFSTGGHWRVVDGELLCPGVKNNPLWLKAKLPANAAVEFDVRSQSPEGDIKVEIFGDGSDHASGYVLIHGGWNNSLSIIARRDEHGVPLANLQAAAQRIANERKLPNASLVETGVFHQQERMRVEANPYPVQLGRKYHWRIERRGSLLSWSIDGQPFMSFDDPMPLTGEKHNRFGFSCWEAQLYFDNLKIEAL